MEFLEKFPIYLKVSFVVILIFFFVEILIIVFDYLFLKFHRILFLVILFELIVITPPPHIKGRARKKVARPKKCFCRPSNFFPKICRPSSFAHLFIFRIFDLFFFLISVILFLRNFFAIFVVFFIPLLLASNYSGRIDVSAIVKWFSNNKYYYLLIRKQLIFHPVKIIPLSQTFPHLKILKVFVKISRKIICKKSFSSKFLVKYFIKFAVKNLFDKNHS